MYVQLSPLAQTASRARGRSACICTAAQVSVMRMKVRQLFLSLLLHIIPAGIEVTHNLSMPQLLTRRKPAVRTHFVAGPRACSFAIPLFLRRVQFLASLRGCPCPSTSLDTHTDRPRTCRELRLARPASSDASRIVAARARKSLAGYDGRARAAAAPAARNSVQLYRSRTLRGRSTNWNIAPLNLAVRGTRTDNPWKPARESSVRGRDELVERAPSSTPQRGPVRPDAHTARRPV